ACVHRDSSSVDLTWAVRADGVREGAAACHHEPSDVDRRPAVVVIGPLHSKRDSVSGWDDDAGRPDLDVEAVCLVRREWLYVAMRVVRAPLGAEVRVELAV